MKIITQTELPGRAAPAPTKHRNRRYDDAYSPSPNDKRPLGFPDQERIDYPVCANSYLHSQSHALLVAQFKGLDPLTFRPDSTFHINQMEVNAGRAMISPDVLNDRDLIRYVEALAPYALGKSELSNIEPQSPLIVPYLLGGLTGARLEELCERVMDVFVFPPDEREGTFADATNLLGFGPQGTYLHIDGIDISAFNRADHESLADWRSRIALIKPEKSDEKAGTGFLSSRQDWLLTKIPNGAFCSTLFRSGAYDESLQRRVSRVKLDVCREAAIVFSEPAKDKRDMAKGLEITEQAWKLLTNDQYNWSRATRIDDVMFQNAVVRVFERPWLELDLVGQPDAVADDMERVMARLIISKVCRGGKRILATPPQLHARTLLGMSLLTGVPVGKFIKFAMHDFVRRGETFIDQQTIIDLMDLIYSTELMAHFSCLDELEGYQFAFQNWEKDDNAKPIARFAHKLRTGYFKLWSRFGRYHMTFPGSTNVRARYSPPQDYKLLGCPQVSPFRVR